MRNVVGHVDESVAGVRRWLVYDSVKFLAVLNMTDHVVFRLGRIYSHT